MLDSSQTIETTCKPKFNSAELKDVSVKKKKKNIKTKAEKKQEKLRNKKQKQKY